MMTLDNSPHPLLPPDLQGKSLRFLHCIHTMPIDGGQPLPLGRCSRPVLRQSPVSRKRAGGHCVVFLRRSSRSRSGAGRVNAPVHSRFWHGKTANRGLALKNVANFDRLVYVCSNEMGSFAVNHLELVPGVHSPRHCQFMAYFQVVGKQ